MRRLNLEVLENISGSVFFINDDSGVVTVCPSCGSLSLVAISSEYTGEWATRKMNVKICFEHAAIHLQFR